ncbi:hypothetical protein P175DRAFT_0532610 [Aspergillus ochraceoroseus IBT 24754]|uniref:Rhodopsin domain-containing protein n=2 Tax=Aspergillus ochraceoroseus TaxID=138278 RepID=A0A2T5LY66_9EURO|nr:uncharacterized protein P175DRAFT_0532610 [Aspergillus ochraceoroseus IBT 24754]KKK19860.1 hypothetical protein AOCH_000567 [Aspergillus ochraceoroseus]PTU21234.1 hypothetical protein P175DRAFT_0532610 [Aspergillus ochraceoroseus IBT 24754]
MSTYPMSHPDSYLTEDQGSYAVTGMAACNAVATCAVMARVYVRAYTRGLSIQDLGWDDALIILAMFVGWALMALSYMVTKYGAGRHREALIENPTIMVNMYKWLVTAQLVYMLNLWICRMSGIAFYVRVNRMPRFKLYLRISYGFVTGAFVTQILIIALQCMPLAALWGEAEGQCMGSDIRYISTSVPTFLCDLLVILLPVNIILKIKDKMTRSIALGFVLYFGTFVIVTSVCRIIAIATALKDPEDITWYFSAVMAWSCAEIATGIVVLSLPVLKGLFSRLRDKYSSRMDQSSSNDGIRPKSNSCSGQRRVFEGPNTIPNKTQVDTACNTSEEQLWLDKTDDIRVVDTVQVDISQRKGLR